MLYSFGLLFTSLGTLFAIMFIIRRMNFLERLIYTYISRLNDVEDLFKERGKK